MLVVSRSVRACVAGSSRRIQARMVLEDGLDPAAPAVRDDALCIPTSPNVVPALAHFWRVQVGHSCRAPKGRRFSKYRPGSSWHETGSKLRNNSRKAGSQKLVRCVALNNWRHFARPLGTCLVIDNRLQIYRFDFQGHHSEAALRAGGSFGILLQRGATDDP
jgi:hypothetical protein